MTAAGRTQLLHDIDLVLFTAFASEYFIYELRQIGFLFEYDHEPRTCYKLSLYDLEMMWIVLMPIVAVVVLGFLLYRFPVRGRGQCVAGE
jgi:hypothetical protein